MNRNVDDLPDQPLDPGGGPIVFTGERRFIVVESGVLELRLAAPDRAGATLPFARVGAGGLAGVLGTPTEPVLAWPERGTRLRQWQPDAPAAQEIPGPLWLALEDWIVGLSRGATLDVGESRLPSETITTVPDGVVLRPPHGVAWLEVLAGRLEYADAPSFFAEAVPGQPAAGVTAPGGAGGRRRRDHRRNGRSAAPHPGRPARRRHVLAGHRSLPCRQPVPHRAAAQG
jgi:hypothetical protein